MLPGLCALPGVFLPAVCARQPTSVYLHLGICRESSLGSLRWRAQSRPPASLLPEGRKPFGQSIPGGVEWMRFKEPKPSALQAPFSSRPAPGLSCLSPL